MTKQSLFLVLTIALGSCASLTKTQVHAVYQFSRTARNFSAYPSKIMIELADIRIKRGIYFSNSLDDAKLHIDELDNLYKGNKSDYAFSKKVDITFKVIDKYAQSLLLLSSDKYVSDLQEQSESFGTDLDSLITSYNAISGVNQVPTGIGAAVNNLIVLGGKQYIRSRQAKEIKIFVPQADTLISIMTSNLLEFLESTNIQDLIENEEKGINSNYLSFLRQRHASIENERDYLELKSNIDLVKQLRRQTVTATRRLRNAHKKLLTVIQTKKTLKETISELQDLYNDVKELNTTIGALRSSKN